MAERPGSFRMSQSSFSKRFLGAALVLAVLTAGAVTFVVSRGTAVRAENPAAAAPPAAPVSVATVEAREIITWEEFSGRLEAVERVEVRPRVSGVIQAV